MTFFFLTLHQNFLLFVFMMTALEISMKSDLTVVLIWICLMCKDVVPLFKFLVYYIGICSSSSSFFRTLFLFYMYDSLPTCIYVYYMHSWCPRRLEGGLHSLELELQTLLASMWVLDSELMIPARAAHALHYKAISPDTL